MFWTMRVMPYHSVMLLSPCISKSMMDSIGVFVKVVDLSYVLKGLNFSELVNDNIVCFCVIFLPEVDS